MFRQKIAEVTNCTCRLIPNDKNDISIFRAPVHPENSLQKDHKEKYSLKNQTISSGKTDPKNISAKKTLSKVSKLSEQDRISITGNIDSKKKKLDRYKICSPETHLPRNFDESMTPSGSLPKAQTNFSKGAYVFRTRDQNKPKDVSKPYADGSNQKTFGALKKFTIAHQNAKTILSSQVNKQNTFKAGNQGQDERVNMKTEKSSKKIRDIVQNPFPLTEVKLNLNHQRNYSNAKTVIQEPMTLRNQVRGEYSQSEQFKNFLNNMRSNSAEKVEGNSFLGSQISSVSSNLSSQKKAHTFNELLGEKKLSESILSDEENESQNSIVVMTFKELIEKNREKEREKMNDINKLSFIKNVNHGQVHKASLLTSESDMLAKLKPYAIGRPVNGI